VKNAGCTGNYSGVRRVLNAGIIGLGVGESHIAGYHAHPECRVVSLCDFSPEKAAQAREKYPEMKVTDRAGDILCDPRIDVVSIASYDNYHYEQITTALANGKHVFVEKPLCLFEHEARQIRDLLETKQGVKLSSNLILRKSPRFAGLKRMIEAGELGVIFHIEGDYNYGRLHKITGGWRGGLDFYSVIYGGSIHLIDLFLWLTGEEVTEVAAAGNAICSNGSRFRFNDMVVGILRFKNGMTGKVTANFGCVYPHFHPLSIYGTKATFENGRSWASLYTSREPDVPPRRIDTEYPGVHKGNLIYSFIDSIVSGGEAEVTPDDVFRAMAVCFALEKATHTSSFVPVEYF
jgi:predicted dehydrogenase